MKKILLLFLSVMIVVLFSCSEQSHPPGAFQQTWYKGKAEISSYTLQQARYGELRDGDAILIFVTEDFSKDKLVKLDNPEDVRNKARVLKMNMTKSFVTGIYPYSMMLSVFTPLSKDGAEQTLKMTSTVQEWCGQTFSSLQLKGSGYKWLLHSYFEEEGDQEKNVDATIAEDEIWNLIRIAPASLPKGKVEMLPALLWQRLTHTDMEKQEATITVSNTDTSFIRDTAVQMCTINYPKLERTLQIYYNTSFPHQIQGWQESYPDGFGKNRKMLTTRATLKKSIWLDYWKHNQLADSTFRDSLQIAPHMK